MHSLNLPQQPVLQILENACSRYEPCTIFIIGHKSSNVIIEQISKTQNCPVHHFYLLVITNRPLPASGSIMANSIYELSGKTITATVLLHKPTDLATKLPHQIRFFDQAIRFGHRLCLDKENPPYLLANSVPPVTIDSEAAFWLKCQAVADYYLEAAGSARLEIERIKIAMLHQAVEQICLGLIRLYSGYTPNTFELRFLLELSEHYTSLPAECFPRQGEANWRRFKSLCAPPSMLRHWVHLDAPEADFLILYQNTSDFLQKATHLAETELKKIAANQSKQ